MYCPNCGSDVGNSNFCSVCGFKLENRIQPNLEHVNRSVVPPQMQHQLKSKHKKSYKKPVNKLKSIIALMVATVIVIGGCSAAFALSRKNKPNYIDFSELKNALYGNEESTRKEYDNKRFYFSIVSDNKDRNAAFFEGQVFDSYGKEWSSDFDSSWRFEYDGYLVPGKKYYITAKLFLTGSWFRSPGEFDIIFALSDVKIIDSSKIRKISDDKPKSFEIEGKWKNVGDSSCAQMQIGSITSFDGTHCNVYSPNDTYAFYESNGEYHLDCTSFFAGDSMNFKVRIIDQNNIELIYDEDTTVKLQKVG